MTTPHKHLNLDEIYDNKTETRPSNQSSNHSDRSQSQAHPTRTQFLKNTYGIASPAHGRQSAENMRLRLKYFCHHVRWICRNIVNLEAIESRKDLVTFSLRNVQKLKTYATNLLKATEHNGRHQDRASEKTMHSVMPDILKLLHALESVVAREYIAPILSINYLKHIQGMGTSLMKPHWSVFGDGEHDVEHKNKIQELSQHVIPVYFNLMTLLHLLDLDLHNSLFYQCTSLIQKYHMVASGRSYTSDEKNKDTSFYDQHVPYLNEVLGFFELIHEMVQDSASSLSVPSSVASLWVHEIKLALNLFDLYKDDL